MASPETFKGYEVVQRIDAGGMAEVHMVRPAGSQATPGLALKRLLPHFRNNPDITSLFRREAELSASLDHPNLVKVVDHGEDYLVMELIHGNDLRSTGAMDARDVLTVVDGVLAALEYCHERGVIHRDLTPANVMFDSTGQVKVLDFGVYQDIGQRNEVAQQALAGKYAYLAPEVARGRETDVRADLFSVGVLAWEMLTGQRLFRGRNDAETITNVVEKEATPPSASNRLIPKSFDAPILQALAKDPAGRFRSAPAMRRAFQEAAKMAGFGPLFDPTELALRDTGALPVVPKEEE